MKSVRYSAFAGIGLVLGAGCLCLLGIAPLPWRAAAADTVHDVPAPPPLAVELVKDAPHTLVVPEDVRKSLGILKGKTEAVAGAQLPTRSLPLVLPGSTALDPTRLMRIRARFAPARVVEIAP